jgi:hypothetical protein
MGSKAVSAWASVLHGVERRDGPVPCTLSARSHAALWTPAAPSVAFAASRRLSEADLKEIDAAVRSVLASGSKLEDVDANDFPLPQLGPVLQVLHRVSLQRYSWGLCQASRCPRPAWRGRSGSESKRSSVPCLKP